MIGSFQIYKKNQYRNNVAFNKIYDYFWTKTYI